MFVAQFSKVIHSRTSLKDSKFRENAGKQYLSCTIGAIIYGIAYTAPEYWDRYTLDIILNQSNDLHSKVFETCNINELDPIASLEIKHFRAMKDSIMMFGKNNTIDFDDLPAICGYLDDDLNNGENYVNLATGISQFNCLHWAGILRANSKFYAIVFVNNTSYFFNPYDCGRHGQEQSDGFPMLVGCLTEEALIYVCRKAIGSTNTYEIFSITPNMFDEFIQEELQKNYGNDSVEKNDEDYRVEKGWYI